MNIHYTTRRNYNVIKEFCKVAKALVQRNKPAVGREIIKSTLKANVTEELAKAVGSELAFLSLKESLATLAQGLYEEIQQCVHQLWSVFYRVSCQRRTRGKAK